jgi:hypothetical protein
VSIPSSDGVMQCSMVRLQRPRRMASSARQWRRRVAPHQMYIQILHTIDIHNLNAFLLISAVPFFQRSHRTPNPRRALISRRERWKSRS